MSNVKPESILCYVEDIGVECGICLFIYLLKDEIIFLYFNILIIKLSYFFFGLFSCIVTVTIR